jgi:hypothetical protein
MPGFNNPVARLRAGFFMPAPPATQAIRYNNFLVF